MILTVIAIIGFLSGIVSLLVFLTGKPSIYHFLPLQKQHLKELPSPFDKWRFVVKENILFLRYESLEIAVLAHLDKLKDYRILLSADSSKFLIAYKHNYEDQFKNIVIANSDGSKRKEHRYPSGIVDVRWFNTNTYLIFLDTNGLLAKYDDKYPHIWRHLDSNSVGSYSWDTYITVGNYLVQLSDDNKISGVRVY